jgi:hypothetical protein
MHGDGVMPNPSIGERYALISLLEIQRTGMKIRESQISSNHDKPIF